MTDPELFDWLVDLGRRNKVPEDGHPDTEAARDYLLRTLERSTVLNRYSRHEAGGHDIRAIPSQHDEPWQAEGARQWAAMCLAIAGRRDGDPTFYSSDEQMPDWMTRAFGLTCAALAVSAQVYLWDAPIEDLAASTPLPRHVVSAETLPYPVMFWCTQKTHIVRTAAGDRFATTWKLVYRTPEAIHTVQDLLPVRTDLPLGEMHIRLALQTVPAGRRYPEEYDRTTIGPLTDLLGRLAFLNSPYVGGHRRRLPRAWRRHGLPADAPGPIRDPEIAVVTLRREASLQLAAQADDEAHGRNYRHQWWVSGHIRSQWYPSEQAHHLIWIAPHLKGPPDAPFRPRVYAVTR